MNMEDLLACVIYGKILWVWVWKNFAGMEKFLWIWYFGYRNILVGYVMLDHEKILWLWFWICGSFRGYTWTWPCGNFFDSMVMGKKLVVVYGHVKSFGCGKIWWGHWFFVVGHWLFWAHGNFLDMWFWSWEFFFFGHVVFSMEKFFVMGNFWSCGNFKWDKYRIHLMRSCSTNLNLSWLALMEFALMRQSRMPLVWKWMHDFIWNLGFLWKDDDGDPLSWKWMRHGWMPLVCKLMHEFLKPWYLRKRWFLFFSKLTRHGRMPLV